MKHILEYIEITAKEHANEPAVDDGNICFTWRELVEVSKVLGSGFSKRVTPGKPVVLFMEKSAATLAAMFGVVYAGCFYVMVDPEQPESRLKEILGVLQPELIITHKGYRESLVNIGYGDCYLLLQDAMSKPICQDTLDEIAKNRKEQDPLYCMFTSGSTGVPKGIIVSHKAVVDFIGHFVDTFGFDSQDRIGNQAPFDFDVSVKDIYTSVMTGATLVLIPRKLFSIPPELLDYICEKKVNTLIWAVSALTLVSSLKGLRYRVPVDVKRVLFSGEVMPVKQLKLWQQALPEAQFVNLYGPTEITCNCTYYPIKRVFEEHEKLPLGIPFPGRQVFLLDDMGNKVTKAETAGEICVAGESISDGYYRNPEETKARFINVPNENEPKSYYRTGDLAYYSQSGELYFAGRKDFQIKHMGHRIELEEIEHSLGQIEGLEKSCCLMDARRNRLVAYYMGSVSEEDVKCQMKSRVPIYMVPHTVRRINQMPLTKNGKTDRNYFKKLVEVGA